LIGLDSLLNRHGRVRFREEAELAEARMVGAVSSKGE
jgi:hypothetical protein